jgi:hypothetical protein
MYDWYRNAIATNFWAITPENLFKWPEYEPEQGAWQQAAQTLQQLYIDFAQVGGGAGATGRQGMAWQQLAMRAAGRLLSY